MSGRYFYIYGAGKRGKSLLNFLKIGGVKVKAFLESSASGKEYYGEIPIIPPEKAKDELKDSIILLAIENLAIRQMIRLKLLHWSVPSHHVLDCTAFIDGNDLMEKGQSICVFCGHTVQKFIPLGKNENLFHEHHIIGGGRRDNSLCPYCGSIDRERWLYYVLLNHTDVFNKTCKILHFAPEKNMVKVVLQSNPLLQYYTADLNSKNVMCRVDMTSIDFPSENFDYVIANHVMEHIENEGKAIEELKRVIKINGKIILSFPICMDMDTFEDSSIVTREDRLKHYGQEDHVRLYGKDYKERLEKYGLKIEVFSPQNEISVMEINRFGFIKDDVIIMCEKK